MITKEELLNELDKVSGMGNVSVNTMRKLLNQFFKDKVIIQRGDNRYPFAEEIHAWVEGIPVEWRGNESCEWKTADFDDYEYRIKPSEPVYAYIWYRECTDEDRKMFSEMEFDSTTVRMTEEELAKNFNSKGWIKIEATKKERT